MKITVWTWKDERLSADKETLKAINKMINKNTKAKRSIFESFLFHFMYLAGILYHGPVSFIKLVVQKISRK